MSFSFFKKFRKNDYEEEGVAPSDDYVEISGEGENPRQGGSKVVVRPFVVEDFTDVKPILDVLREGYTVALINIRPLKDKDLIELKRAINKLKKTTDAIEGDIAGFGDDYVVIVPSFAEIYRQGPAAAKGQPQAPGMKDELGEE
ncbi:MAG: cell division protein SepF [Nanoarchaeota archaeon]